MSSIGRVVSRYTDGIYLAALTTQLHHCLPAKLPVFKSRGLHHSRRPEQERPTSVVFQSLSPILSSLHHKPKAAMSFFYPAKLGLASSYQGSRSLSRDTSASSAGLLVLSYELHMLQPPLALILPALPFRPLSSSYILLLCVPLQLQAQPARPQQH